MTSADHSAVHRLSTWALPGIAEIAAGDDLAAIIGDAVDAAARLEPGLALADGDILSVTSKIVSKAEGRQVAADDREDAITAETVRVVASREHPGGVTRIVENRLGIVAAAAGVDASNTPEGTVLLLPEDPDASAAALRTALQARFGVQIGIVITDTLGRPWRLGQTDVAIGAAGVRVVDDLRGATDSAGRVLAVTTPAVADEIAAMTDLVKGKIAGCPVAVVRGLGRLVTHAAGPGARSIVRTGESDMFRLGTAEAFELGRQVGRAEQEQH
ncbi:MAG TPA: coenzyme F420-0:L-glutamate ligase [Microbacteriaceae bacterium]|nr:coenzyme F420-0:L-glutamate ligase [Microbacteriaceae bacterium]